MADFLASSQIVLCVRELWDIPFKTVGIQWLKFVGDTVFSSVKDFWR